MSREERLERFASFPERLSVAARAAADKPTPPGEWGPTEVVRHLIAVEDEVHMSRLRQLLVEDEPHWQWTEPGLATALPGTGLTEILAAFATARAGSVRFIRELDDDSFARSGTHATYGRLDVHGLLRVASDHDMEHLIGLNGG